MSLKQINSKCTSLLQSGKKINVRNNLFLLKSSLAKHLHIILRLYHDPSTLEKRHDVIVRLLGLVVLARIRGEVETGESIHQISRTTGTGTGTR